MTEIAVRCALLQVAVDPGRLYDTTDVLYLEWLATVTDRVNAENRRQAQESKRGR